MPDQPERDIERQLRASAEQRRAEAGAPFELPDATRRRLQAEVTRRHGSREDRRTASSAWWLALWPRFAFGGALLAVLGLGIWLSVPTSSNMQPANLVVASNEKDSAAKVDKQFSPAMPGAKPLADVEAPAEAKATLAPATMLATDTREEKKSEQVATGQAARTLTESAISPPATPTPAVATAAPQSAAAQPRALEAATATQPSSVDNKLPQSSAGGRRGGGGGGFGGGGGRGGFGGGSAGGGRGFGGGGARSSLDEPSLADSSKVQSKDGDALSAADTPAAIGQLARAQGASTPAATGRTTAPVLGDVPLNRQNTLANAWLFRNSAVPTNVRSDVVTVRRGIAPARAPASPAVLNSFRAEQTGDTLRIVDEDGSVYEGKLQVPADDVALSKAKELDQIQTQTRARDARPSGAVIPSQTQQMAPTLNFNVSGMNRSLTQRVVFTGQLQQAISPGTANSQSKAQFFAPIQGAAQASFSNSQTQKQQAQQAPDAGQQQRIVGRARLGATPEFEVDAFSTSK